jgi:hypothetical protein
MKMTKTFKIYFKPQKNSKAKISAVYENLDAADMEHLEDIIHRDCIQEE